MIKRQSLRKEWLPFYLWYNFVYSYAYFGRFPTGRAFCDKATQMLRLPAAIANAEATAYVLNKKRAAP